VGSTYFEYGSVALVIQNMEGMCRIILSSVGCSVLPYSSTLSHKRYDFRGWVGGVVEHKMCFDFLYKFCLKNLSF